jgi:hypothetical protein
MSTTRPSAGFTLTSALYAFNGAAQTPDAKFFNGGSPGALRTYDRRPEFSRAWRPGGCVAILGDVTDALPGAGDGVLEEALDRLSGCGPEFGPGLSNHGPMVAEALVRMGQGAAVSAFVDRYQRALEPAPPPGKALASSAWGAALGDYDRYADFLATFESELTRRAVSEVLADWVPRLAPGSIGAAGHGLIRTAHARRALHHADTPLRRRELAEGLAYWAARYLELPGPPVLIGQGSVEAQLGALPSLPNGSSNVFLITDQVKAIDDVAKAFESVVVGLVSPSDPQLALDAIAAGGANAYVRNADRGHAIALVHSITLPMALELLLDDLRVGDRSTTFAYVWQAAAALHVCYAVDRRPIDPTDLLTDLPYPEDLITAAVESGDEHAIKLTEAGLRAYQRSGEPVLLAASADANRRLA